MQPEFLEETVTDDNWASAAPVKGIGDGRARPRLGCSVGVAGHAINASLGNQTAPDASLQRVP